MSKNTKTIAVALVALIAVLVAALGVLLWMLWANLSGSDSTKAEEASPTATVDPETVTPSPTPGGLDGLDALDGLDGEMSLDMGGEASPLAVEGELLPVGVPVDIEFVDFFDDVHPMTITVDGVTQNGDCTIVLLQLTPEGDLDSFDLPVVGMVSGGLHYEGGACVTTGLEDAGYASSIGLDLAAGQTAVYYDFAQRPGGSLADVEAITVEIATDAYVFFEPAEKSLT